VALTQVINKGIGAGNTVTGEGSATTSLQQGLAKAWVNFDGSASGAASVDSFNESGMTDNGTGDYTFTMSNAMSNANYSSNVTGSNKSGAANHGVAYINKSSAAPTTTALRVIGKSLADASNQDLQIICVAIHGDLA
tara:strand:- start:40 stop:450 length:411 start_codon:yes stop_codon:yes gene_type:complete